MNRAAKEGQPLKLTAGRIVWFFVKVVAIYALLIAPWPGWEEAYAKVFRAGGNALFSAFGAQGRVQFEPMEQRQGMWDTQIRLMHRQRPGAYLTIGETSRYTGYLPSALVGALVLSTPVSWRRRLWSLCWGLALANAFVVFRLWVQIFYEYRIHPGSYVGMYDPGPRAGRGLGLFVEFISVSPVITCAVPVAIWLVVTFRRRDWPGKRLA